MLGKWLPQLSPTAQSLLESERAAHEDEALQERALERARAALEGERWSGVQMRQADDVAPSRRRWGSLRTALLVAAALAVAGLATAGVRLAVSQASRGGVAAVAKTPAPPLLRGRPSEPRVAAAPAPAPESTVPAATGAAPTSLPPTSASPPSNAAITPPSGAAHARPSTAETYAIEVGLLEPARSGIARGDFATALGALARHQREYPNGQLSQEREALRVRALWGSGQKQAAESAAAAFRRRYPQSGLLSWMKTQPAP